jgi:8-hydroxy-5-deazaflavin:NADPH oxidoreductase
LKKEEWQMKIGIIGAGNIGTAVGKRLAAKGHQVFLSFSRSAEDLAKAARTVGCGVQSGSVEDSVAFADLIVLGTPYSATADALRQAGRPEGRKILWDCTNALKADMSGLEIGLTTSAAEEVQKLAPWTRVVKGIPPSAYLLHSTKRLVEGKKVSVFLCSNDQDAKKTVASLVEEIDADPVDAGPLQNARYTEPAGYLIVQLYLLGRGGRIGMSFLRE